MNEPDSLFGDSNTWEFVPFNWRSIDGVHLEPEQPQKIAEIILKAIFSMKEMHPL